MRKNAVILVVMFALLFSLKASAQQDVYNEKKALRGVEIEVGNLSIFFDYMPVLATTLRESVLADRDQKIYPLVIVPIKIKNISEAENFYELAHKIKADIIIYEPGLHAIGGFEGFFYLNDNSDNKNNSRQHIDGLEILLARKVEYTGQLRTALDKNILYWFLQPEIKPDMEVYAKVAISIDGFETMHFTTSSTKVRIVY
ncbi:MAG: hypothetical protein G01um101444_2 [Parcubacteria group bacterium Gr01-1014_44]|nr:MAG: hypothetical protein G01um101444_2 [Parcubacteria group bacterium Gr01-1014_44]